MARIKVKNEIKIERNVIENFLMNLKDFVGRNRKIVLYSFFAIVAVMVVTIGVLVYIEKASLSQQVRYEEIMDNYRKGGAQNSDNIDKTIASLKELADSTYFGFTSEMPCYVIGNLYFSIKKYKEAEAYLLKYEDVSSPSVFSAMALLKASMAAEERNDIDTALSISKRLEEDYSDSIIADQVLFNLGRIYGIRKDEFMSKKYYNDVISLYPRSSLAEKAKKRLLMTGIK